MGSSNYITNFVGDVSQHVEYFAFGETFIEEHLNSHNSPYKFNDYGGKSFKKAFNEHTARSAELDEETGFYYYGARYYNPRTSVWLSVDPLVEQTMQPYQYCYQNPIVYFDPDGNSPISMFVKAVAKAGLKKAGKAFIKNQIKKRLASYGSKAWGKQLLKDAVTFIDHTMKTAWWEWVVEAIPVAGDAYGAGKLGKQGYTMWKGLERIEAIANLGVKASKRAWKKLGSNSSLTGKGADKLRGFINKFNNQGTHLNADDLGGAIKEKFGLSSNGQHLNEVTEVLYGKTGTGGMYGQLNKLKNAIKRGEFEGDALESAKGVYRATAKQYNEIHRVLKSADKQVKKIGKFEKQL